MDISIEIMLPTRGSGDFSEAGNARYPMLGIVAVYDHLKTTDNVGMPRTGYVHVTDGPTARSGRGRGLLPAFP
jgi:hypothetical protein